METVTKMAWNPDTEQEYKIELPAESIVEEALLELDYPADGLHKKEVAEMLAERFSLTGEQRNAKYKNGSRVFNDYLGRVSATLVKSGRMVRLSGGRRRAKDFQEGSRDTEASSVVSGDMENQSDGDVTGPIPEESIDKSYQKVQEKLAVELLQKIQNNTPAFFEKLVVDLLVKMGYGGSQEDAQAVGRGGDGGIDGIINEDRLGLDVVYVQAKRWEGNVSRPEIQKFAGALQGQRARKGIFITTSDFTRDAEGYVKTIDSKIILINGKQLAEYMIEHNVGVSTTKTYEIKRVDSDYFAEDTE